METISKRLKSTLRKEMERNRIYSNDEIRQLIYEKTGMKYGVDYMETHFAGCLSALKKSGDIKQVQRGEYIKGNIQFLSQSRNQVRPNTPDSAESAEEGTMFLAQTKKEVLESLQKERAYLKSVAQNIVLSFDTPEADIQYMLKLKELDRGLEELERMMM